MMGEAQVAKWVSPETQQKAGQTARDRAKAARWDLNIAVFLFAVLIIVTILLFQGVGITIAAPVAIFGLAMVWLTGWRRGRQLYQRFYDEELAKYPEDWVDYYKILRISPSAEPKAITAAYQRLAHIYHKALSDETKKLPLYAAMISEINEAYQVLSDPLRRTAYDRIFWLKCGADSADVELPDKAEIVDVAQSITEYVRQRKTGRIWRIPRWDKVTQRVVSAAAIAVLAIVFGGTALAFAKPEHALATPFKGIAITLTKASVEAISLIDDVRGVTATHEHQIVSTALQAMRVEEGLKEIAPVSEYTNDMMRFPSQEHCLFPSYVNKRFTQFKYTVDSKGIVSVDTSWATTDAFLEKIKQLLERLGERE